MVDAMGIRIVIADDESITRMDIREILQNADYEVIGEAGDGIDAVELCDTLKPDLLLLDIKMPIMDGITAARLIHEKNPAIAIVMLTAYNDSQFVDKAGEFGVVGYIVKPVNEKTLIPTIKVAVRRSGELNDLREKLTVQKQKMEERKLTERAKGILMKRNGISEEEAYRYLRSVSMNKRKSISEVSRMVIETYRILER